MNARFDSPSRVRPDQFSLHQTRRPDAKPTSLTRPASAKFDEKETMRGLNERLAGFIEKVHQLEQHNNLLEREIEELRGRAQSASALEEEYGPEVRRLRRLVQDISQQKHQVEIEHHRLEDELCSLRGHHDREAQSRSEAQSNFAALKRDMSDAFQAKLLLDKKAQSLLDEIDFLKRSHEAEVSEIFDRNQSAQCGVGAREFGPAGVTAALRDIRAQLEGGHADLPQMGDSFRSQFARITGAADAQREALRATQQEIQEYKRRLQAKSVELDCARGTREAVERQLREVEDRHREELIHYQNTIKELENELINCKFDMSGYLREYQDLLNVKMALDVEILSYRKLLCGEEARLSTGPDSHISLPHVYHQSPVYTLPCFTRPGPKYKFVEEIITETTREIEMSEFEETGSEGTEEGRDEREFRKSGGSEEESDHKDSGEHEGNQVPDTQQGGVRGGEDEGQRKGEESPQMNVTLNNNGGKTEQEPTLQSVTQESAEHSEQKQTSEREPQTHLPSEWQNFKSGAPEQNKQGPFEGPVSEDDKETVTIESQQLTSDVQVNADSDAPQNKNQLHREEEKETIAPNSGDMTTKQEEFTQVHKTKNEVKEIEIITDESHEKNANKDKTSSHETEDKSLPEVLSGKNSRTVVQQGAPESSLNLPNVSEPGKT